MDLRLLYNEPELLPETCAYRLLLAGKELPEYHPLVSGVSNSAHEAQQTVLEMRGIYSITELNETLKKCNQTLYNKHSTFQQRVEALEKLKSLEPAHLMSYDIP